MSFLFYRRSHRHDLGSTSFNPAFFHEASSSQNRGISQYPINNNADIQLDQQDNNTEVQQPEKMLIVWGTNIVVKDVVSAFRNFLENFTFAHLPDENLAISSTGPVDRYSPFYPRLLAFMHSVESRYCCI